GKSWRKCGKKRGSPSTEAGKAPGEGDLDSAPAGHGSGWTAYRQKNGGGGQALRRRFFAHAPFSCTSFSLAQALLSRPPHEPLRAPGQRGVLSRGEVVRAPRF